MDLVAPAQGDLVIPPMSAHAVDTVRRLETELRKMEQAPFVTKHDLHAGMYARTVTLPPGLWTGTQVKRGTILVIVGDAFVYTGEDEPLRVTGTTILRGSAGRKQALWALTEVTVFAVAVCDAATEAEAEAFMTDELDLLVDRADKHLLENTGE